MTTKKQNEMLKNAIFFIENELIEGGQRAWDSLFEDNENNTNALIIGLTDYMEGRPDFCKSVIRQEKYMPVKLVRYAHIYTGEVNPLVKKLVDEVEILCTDLEGLLNQIDDINRFNYDIKEKWDYLNRYYIEPLAASYEKVTDAYCEVDL